jgi:5-methyltetrahydrofolate--homocysteine methyltransferase
MSVEDRSTPRTSTLVSLAAARANKTPIEWASYTPPKPRFIGRRVLKNVDLAVIAACID